LDELLVRLIVMISPFVEKETQEVRSVKMLLQEGGERGQKDMKRHATNIAAPNVAPMIVAVLSLPPPPPLLLPNYILLSSQWSQQT